MTKVEVSIAGAGRGRRPRSQLPHKQSTCCHCRSAQARAHPRRRPAHAPYPRCGSRFLGCHLVLVRFFKSLAWLMDYASGSTNSAFHRSSLMGLESVTESMRQRSSCWLNVMMFCCTHSVPRCVNGYRLTSAPLNTPRGRMPMSTLLRPVVNQPMSAIG